MKNTRTWKLLRTTAHQMDKEIEVEEPSLAYFTDLVQKETEPGIRSCGSSSPFYG